MTRDLKRIRSERAEGLQPVATSRPPVNPIALDLRDASEAIGLGRGSRWLLEPDCPVAKCDMRRPNSERPVWRWFVDDLRAFVESRRVQPGHINPQDR